MSAKRRVVLVVFATVTYYKNQFCCRKVKVIFFFLSEQNLFSFVACVRFHTLTKNTVVCTFQLQKHYRDRYIVRKRDTFVLMISVTKGAVNNTYSPLGILFLIINHFSTKGFFVLVICISQSHIYFFIFYMNLLLHFFTVKLA